MADGAWLIAGLGNPGETYAATRHNVGFMCADVLAARMSTTFKRSRKHRSLVAEGRDGDFQVVLAKPQTFMNESGSAIASLLGYYKIPLERLIVMYDEIELAFAQLRVRFGGGTAGHNGMRSIVASVGADFARVRIGVSRPPGRKDPSGHVLSPFTKAERKEMDVTIEEGADAALMIVHEGVQAAQNQYN